MSMDRRIDATRHLARAQTLLAAGQPGEALNEAQEALRHNPSLPAAQICQARAQLALGRAREALLALDQHDLYEPARRMEPEIASLRAAALCAAGLDDVAGPALEQMAHTFPDDTRAHEVAAGAAMRQGRTDHATEALSELVRLRPGDVPARLALTAMLEPSRPDLAATALERLAATARDAVTDLWLARLCRRCGRRRDAEALYDRLLDSVPDDATVWREAGLLADESGASELAVRRLHKALTLERTGNDGASLEALAQALLHRGCFEAAGRVLWRLARRREGWRGWAGLAACALATGRWALAHRARRHLSQGTSRSQRREAFIGYWRHAAVGAALVAARGAQLHRHEASTTTLPAGSPLRGLLLRSGLTLRSHAQRHPGRADTHFHLSRVLDAVGRIDEARASLDRALAINPRYAAALSLRDALAPASQAIASAAIATAASHQADSRAA